MLPASAEGCCAPGAQLFNAEADRPSPQAAQQSNVQGQQQERPSAAPAAQQPSEQEGLLLRRVGGRSQQRLNKPPQYFNFAVDGKTDFELRHGRKRGRNETLAKPSFAPRTKKQRKGTGKTNKLASTASTDVSPTTDACFNPRRQMPAVDVFFDDDINAQIESEEIRRQELAAELPRAQYEEEMMRTKGYQNTITEQQLLYLERSELMAVIRLRKISLLNLKQKKTDANLREIIWWHEGTQLEVKQGMMPEYNIVPCDSLEGNTADTQALGQAQQVALQQPAQPPAQEQQQTQEEAQLHSTSNDHVVGAIQAFQEMAAVLTINEPLMNKRLPDNASTRRLNNQAEGFQETVAALGKLNQMVNATMKNLRRQAAEYNAKVKKRKFKREAKQRKITAKQLKKEKIHEERLKKMKRTQRNLQDTAPPRPHAYDYHKWNTCTPCPCPGNRIVLTKQGVRVKQYDNEGKLVWTTQSTRSLPTKVTKTYIVNGRPVRIRRERVQTTTAPDLLEFSANVTYHPDVQAKVVNLCLWKDGDVWPIEVLVLQLYSVPKKDFNPPHNLTIVAGYNAEQILNAHNLHSDDEDDMLHFWHVMIQGQDCLTRFNEMLQEMNHREGFYTSVVQRSVACSEKEEEAEDEDCDTREDHSSKKKEAAVDDREQAADIVIIVGAENLLGVSGQVVNYQLLQITEKWNTDNLSDAEDDCNDKDYQGTQDLQHADDDGSVESASDGNGNSDASEDERYDTDSSVESADIEQEILEKQAELAFLQARQQKRKYTPEEAAAERAPKEEQRKRRKVDRLVKIYYKRNAGPAASSQGDEGDGNHEGDAAAGASSNAAAGASSNAAAGASSNAAAGAP